MKHKEIMRQWLDGASVQYFCKAGDKWRDLSHVDDANANPGFHDAQDYRIKPERTPAQLLGLQAGDYVCVKRPGDYSRNGLFQLEHDDGSHCPWFKYVRQDGVIDDREIAIDLRKGGILKVEF